MGFYVDNQLILEGSREAIERVISNITLSSKEVQAPECLDFDAIVPRPSDEDSIPYNGEDTPDYNTLGGWLTYHWGTDRCPYDMEFHVEECGRTHIVFETNLAPCFPILKSLQEKYGSDVNFTLQYYRIMEEEHGTVKGTDKKLDSLINKERKFQRKLRDHALKRQAERQHKAA